MGNWAWSVMRGAKGWILLHLRRWLVAAGVAVSMGAIGLCGPVTAAAGLSHQTVSVSVSVPAAALGTLSGFTLKAGVPVVVTGSGSASQGNVYTGPNGLTSWCPGPAPRDFMAPGLPCFGLLARVGDGAWVFIGTGPVTLTGSGAVIFVYNDQLGAYENNAGAYTATITYTCQPGNGVGDPNHYHCGAPGLQ